MNKEICNHWADLLESGKYKQGKHYLCQIDGMTNEYKFCCLGILTEMYQSFLRETGKTPYDEHISIGLCRVIGYSNKEKDFYQIPSSEILIWADLDEDLALEFAQLNDDGASFKEIAKSIRNIINSSK